MGDQSILFEPAAIATLANEHALKDLEYLFFSLALWNKSPPPVFLYCTSAVAAVLPKFKYPGTIYVEHALESYKGLNRQQMERAESRRRLPNLFYDFTMEKCKLMEWALKSLSYVDQKRGVLFCDADIIWFGPLPKIPQGKSLGLSQHMIRHMDELKFGTYNAGFLWLNDVSLAPRWDELSRASRFFEQAALEDLGDSLDLAALHQFGPEYNYGWWRMYQSEKTPHQKQSEWTIKRSIAGENTGICVNGTPLACIHTHIQTKDAMTAEFNRFVLAKLSILKSQSKVRALLNKLTAC
jgi:hypothetical protein